MNLETGRREGPGTGACPPGGTGLWGAGAVLPGRGAQSLGLC